MEQKANALNTMGNGKENKWQAVLPSLSLSLLFCVVAEPNLATCLRILSGTWGWQQRGHMCGIMRMLRQGKSCMQCCLVLPRSPLPAASCCQQINSYAYAMSLPYVQLHTPSSCPLPFPLIEGRNSSSKRCPHCCVRLTANMTRGCDWAHYVELLEMDSAVQPWGTLSFSVLPPPLPLPPPGWGQMKSI